jgi:Flp pilus assembly protein TadD
MPALSFRPLCLLIAGCALAPGVALAQGATPTVSHPVVQAVPGGQGMKLNEALNRLARNPQDIEALLAAGKASLDLGDVQAAVGFYQRAAALAPDNGRVKAGLAGAYVLSEDPFTAIPLFEQAALAGALEPERLADRGLAYDMVGDNQTAQAHYRASLAAGPTDEALRRLALSLAIAGDRKGMDLTLTPLLQRQDKAAWRTRAFGLAILGDAEDAETIALQTMPAGMANSITAYLRYMPRLTRAQQAAAANLGHFPRAAQIGQDDPRVAQFARPAAVLAKAEPVVPVKGDAAGRAARGRVRVPEPAARVQPAAPPPEPKVGREELAPAPQLATATPRPQPVAAPPSTPAAAPVLASPVKLEPSSPAVPATTQDEPLIAPFKPAIAAPAPPPLPPPPAVRSRPSLDEAFADLAPPSREVEVASGAVDIRKVATLPPAKGKDAAKADPAKDKAKEAKSTPKPSHPSRIWVQVATGRDKKALAFDWNRMIKADPAVFKARKGFVSAWGQTNRLLTGPFESEASAKGYIGQLKKAGVSDAFLWTSPAGQAVDALPAGK